MNMLFRNIFYCLCLIAILAGCDIVTDPGTPSRKNTIKDIDIFVPSLEPPVLSHTSGFYEDDFLLTISHPDPDAIILYTTDGSKPMLKSLSGVSYVYKNRYAQYPGQESGHLKLGSYRSNFYSEPIRIRDRSDDPNVLAKISSTWHYRPDYFPAKPIRKAAVLKARAFSEEGSSVVITKTFFVSDESAFDTNLPIVSITLNEDALFDYEEGIYVAGRDFDKWRRKHPNGITTGHRASNYRRRGDDSEKPATFQYFVDKKEVLNQQIGLRLHGAFSRHAQNKSFRLYARKEYDEQKRFNYSFFGDTNSSSFKRLILRNAGNDVGNEWIGAAKVPTISPAVYFRDAFIQKTASHLRFDTQDYTPVVTYVNGEYWGLLNMRERYDKHYIERKYGIEEGELDLLRCSARVEEGDDEHYLDMLDYVSVGGLAREERYDHVKTLMDVDNFTDYSIVQIYIGNTDWPQNNIMYFRKRTDEYEPDAPYGQDGRWRWIMYDTDYGFGWKGADSYKKDTLRRASKGENQTRILLAKLLENEAFRNGFINRYADLLNTAFLAERLKGMIDDFSDRIAEEIPYHQERWSTLQNWEEHLEGMHFFADKRPEYCRSHIMKKFDIDEEIVAELSVSDVDHGYIQINSIELTGNTPGINDDPFPWAGVYFKDIPITVTAVPKNGYAFSHWSGQRDSTKPVVTITPIDDFSLVANFVPTEDD